MYRKLHQFLTSTKVLEAVTDEPSYDDPKLGSSRYPKVVEEIHHAFDTEAQNLLNQAKNILETKTIDSSVESKADLASKLGFGSIKECQDTRAHREEVSKNKRILDAVVESIEFLPQNKWIPESSVERICEKYNLVFGESILYKGFLPTKNLLEIKDFSDKHKEKFNLYYRVTRNVYTPDRHTEISQYVFDEESKRKTKSMYAPGYYTQNSLEKLKICAPLKDMNTRGYELEGRKLVHIPDPIVLCEKSFKGIKGYYIVTAWGDEASDPEVEGYNNG